MHGPNSMGLRGAFTVNTLIPLPIRIFFRKEGRKEGRREGRMDGWVDGRTEGRKNALRYKLCPTPGGCGPPCLWI